MDGTKVIAKNVHSKFGRTRDEVILTVNYLLVCYMTVAKEEFSQQRNNRLK